MIFFLLNSYDLIAQEKSDSIPSMIHIFPSFSFLNMTVPIKTTFVNLHLLAFNLVLEPLSH